MANSSSTAAHDSKHSPYLFILLSAMATIAAANAALIFTMIGMLNWQQSLVLIFAAGTLTGGALFTAWTMRGLSSGDRVRHVN